MASISNDPNGRRRILFINPAKDRKSIRLGKVSLRQAEAVKVKIEDLVSAAITGHPASDETSRWLVTLDQDLYDKLAAVDLVRKREAPIIGAFCQCYIDGRMDIKPGTRINLERIQRYLVEFFGEKRALRSITAGEAEDFQQDLLGKGKSDNTVRRSIGRARQFFNSAKRRGMIQSNPFDGLAATVRPNAERFYFVSRQEAAKVIEACPDTQWRLLFALCRFGGLRCPSEVLSLTWADVNWEHNRIRVPSPKTEHHEGGGSRMIPLFPELHPHLLEAFEEAEAGEEHVITRYRDVNANLRTQLHRIIKRAGLEPWPKTFQNLRSTRETELAEEFPMHVVCKWIGNSEPVAAAHYLQLTDEHFERAVNEGPKAAQNAAQKAHEGTGNGPNLGTDEDAENPEIARDFQAIPEGSAYFTEGKVTGVGLEPTTSGLKGRCSTN